MAYPGAAPPGPRVDVDFSELLPYQTLLRNGVPVVLFQLIIPSTVRDYRRRIADPARREASQATVNSMRALLNLEIVAGRTYPFESEMSEEAFLAYYCGYDVFVLRTDASYNSDSIPHSAEVPLLEDRSLVGCFYIKPNFPGRSGHICNAGFLVAPAFRNSGAGYLMAERFRHLAKALGYRGSMFNLVYRTNEASNKLWDKLGFTNIAVIPKAGRLILSQRPPEHRTSSSNPSSNSGGVEEGYVDALMWFFDFTVPHIPHLKAPWEPPRAGVYARPSSNL